ncbi:IS110 family transposase [Streptomyces griseochromogenes]|uniref:IS110 family transposase n=2 Tax=Streptomyces griseochromogenes TaxID=68214 RepID=UPI001F466B85|nr:IS110 family transposase [Streptomyces griseochromogenes]
MSRFPSAAHQASRAGMCPGKDTSGKSRPGDPWLKGVLGLATSSDEPAGLGRHGVRSAGSTCSVIKCPSDQQKRSDLRGRLIFESDSADLGVRTRSAPGSGARCKQQRSQSLRCRTPLR